MENLSHSRPPNRASTSISKKICNGNSAGGPFVAQTIYDDVYGGPPKFGVSSLSPRFEDYGEIFGSFHALRASSIPILDLPAVDESEVFFDARSSAFDYTEVFGGCDGLDFAVSYEELINPSNSDDDGSSEEAWTPAGTESLSDCSDRSGKSQCMSNGDSHQSSEGSTEFFISYDKVNHESNGNISNGDTHVTQLQVLPGFTYLVDEADPSMKGIDDDPLLQATDDRYLNIDFNTGKVKGKHIRKTKPLTNDSNGHGLSFENNLISQDGYGRDVCGSNEDLDFITVSEINLRTEPTLVPPPSRPPPMFSVKNGDSSIGKLSNYREAASEVIIDDHSLPLFDVEVDASSSAAASAAAMKEAMEKAQAQLQNAKDMWERKKEGIHGRVKFDSKNDMKEKLTKDKVQGIGEINGHDIKLPTREERHKVVKVTEVFSNPYGGEELLTAAEKTLEDRHRSQLPVTEKHDSCSKWKEASEFFELARGDISGREFEPASNGKISNFVHEQGEADTTMEAWKCGENRDKEVKPFQPIYVQQQKGNNIGTMVHGKEEDNVKLKPNKHETRQREQMKLKVPLGVGDLEANDKKIGVAQEFVDTKEQMSEASKLENYDNHIEFKQRENELEVEQPILLKDFKQKENKVVKRKENESYLKESYRKENSRNKMEEAIENEKKENLPRESFEREKLEQGMRVVLEQQENKKRLNMVIDEEENLKGQKVGERPLERVSEEEDYGRREKKPDQIGVPGRFKLPPEQELKDNINCSKDFQNREEYEKRDSIRKVDFEGMPRNAVECEETRTVVKDSHERAELKGNSMGHDERLKDRQKANSMVETQAYMEVDDFKQSPGARQMDDNKNHQATNLARDHFETMRMSQEFLVLDESGERMTRVTVCESSSESGDIESPRFDENYCASRVCQPEVEHHKFPVRMEDAKIPPPLDEWTKKAGKEIIFEPKAGGMQAEALDKEDVLLFESSPNMVEGEGENEIEKNTLKMEDMKKSLPQDGSDEKAGQADYGMEQVPVGRMEFVTRMDFDPQHQEKLFRCMEDKSKSFNQVEEKEQEVSVPRVEVRAEKGREAETIQCTISEGIRKCVESAHEVNADRATERKEKSVNQSKTSKGKESERVRSEQEFENDILRKMEEEREREREREKDRMPVDRIALEPRDKLAAEGRERAERAALERLTAEARQKALAEARERLEKACAEARESSQAGKATMEARVRAERAAVERATAEARDRAVEKAMADRTSFGVRERIERSISEKFSASSRNNETRQMSSSTGQPKLQSQSFGPSIASRYTYYEAYDERNEGVDGESPQRCKARFERHRRTEERAAKALAEKNMRDLLAQREQAERNRLAETLDADVRRWSSGKEGNLRALLSTLQYILGHDSGWQPIPLTEVITAAAVKKAYRKATLCVHPDKLQQRGASIQQKYICEKVFDLLKEAWNKFNSEER